MQDTVLVIYTVGYPPRLVPVSLVLPGLDVSPSSLFSSVPDMAPAPAPGAYAKAPAATPAMSAPAGGAQPPAAFVQLAGRPIAVNRTAQAPTASSQSKAIKVPNLPDEADFDALSLPGSVPEHAGLQRPFCADDMSC